MGQSRCKRFAFTLLWFCAWGVLWEIPLHADEPFERTLESSLDYDDVSRVDVAVGDGLLTVQAWDDWRVALQTQCKVEAASEEEARAYLQSITTQSQFENEVASFEVVTPERERPLAELRWQHVLYLPSEVISSLRIRQTSGVIQLQGMHGTWDIGLEEGSIELLEVTGDFHLSVRWGSIAGQVLLSGESDFRVDEGAIELTMLDSVPQPTKFTLGMGDLTLMLPEDYPAKLDAETQSGEIQVDLPMSEVVQETSKKVEAVLAQSGPPMLIRTEMGDIRIWDVAGSPDEWETTDEPTEPVPPPLVRVPVVEITPQVDGQLNDPIWRRAARIADFYSEDGSRLAKTATEAYFARDAKHLYLAARMHEPELGQIHISQVARDGALALDDSIEWWIAPTETDLYVLQANSLGVTLDRHIGATGSDAFDTDAWNPSLNTSTGFSGNAWFVEIALPLESLGNSEDSWGLNVRRFRSDSEEHSYWYPTDEALGVLEFADQPEQETWLAEQIRIRGNEQVPQEWFLSYLQLEDGSEILPQELPEIEQVLRDSGLFQSVTLRFVPGETGIILDIEVAEEELVSHEEITFTGNANLPTSFLKTRLGWRNPRMATAQFWDTQCLLVENLYDGQDYPLATVGWTLTDGHLSVQVDEGRLDAILIEGTKRLSEQAIRAQLNYPREQPYRQNLANQRKQVLLQYLRNQPAFEELEDWRLIQEAGQKVLFVRIRERSGVQEDLSPLVDFNRVQGLVLGGGLELSTMRPGQERAYGMLSYGFSNERWNYLVGFDKSRFEKHRTTLGFCIYRLTDTPDFGLVSPNEEFLAAFLWGGSYQDYYQREGMSEWFRQQITPSTALEIQAIQDDYRHLLKTTNWSLFRRDFPKRSNQRIWQGKLHTLQVTYSFDSRDAKGHTKRQFRRWPIPHSATETGWLGYLRYEKVGGGLQGDFDYQRGEFLVTRYQKLSEATNVDVRFMGAVADETLPPQKRAYLGGIGTLRGYAFKEWVGDNMLLVNVDWRWWFSQWRAVALFADLGYVWQHTGEFRPEETQAALGVGLLLGEMLRLDLAQPLESERDPELLLRLERMF